jgi:nicotinamidase-related amidase
MSKIKKIKKGNKKTKKYFKRKAGKKSKKNVKKYYTGGAISEITDLYNSLLYKKGTEKGVNFVTDNNAEKEGKKALFVIDMQKDLMDKPYQRKKQGDLSPIFGDSYRIGNFSVVDGQNMIKPGSEFMVFVESAIKSDDYKHVFFSRVYHPIGHKSFSKEFKKAPALLCENCNGNESDYPDGNFPAHCVQGFEGSLFDDNIKELLEKVENVDVESVVKTKQKVKIVFKGMHNDVDSFTAVDFGDMKMDDIASNNQGHCKCENGKQCSGSYLRKDGSLKEDITFNETVNNIDEEFTKVDYKTLLKDVDVIEVCGFSGDYSVRDTIVALSNMFQDKKIVLLGDFTRYISLPFNTIMKIPIHDNFFRYQNMVHNLLDDDEIMSNNTDADIKKYFLEQVQKVEKDIRYYLIHYDEDGTEKFTTYNKNDNLFADNFGFYHFITPHSVILNDYKKNNIFVEITKPVEVSEVVKPANPLVNSIVNSEVKPVVNSKNNTTQPTPPPRYLNPTVNSKIRNENKNKSITQKKLRKPFILPIKPLSRIPGKGNIINGGKTRKIKRKIRR